MSSSSGVGSAECDVVRFFAFLAVLSAFLAALSAFLAAFLAAFFSAFLSAASLAAASLAAFLIAFLSAFVAFSSFGIEVTSPLSSPDIGCDPYD